MAGLRAGRSKDDPIAYSAADEIATAIDPGNVTRRIAPWGTDITLTYDAENRLTQVSNGVTASYTYDSDGQRVKAVVNGTTSYYVGAYYEVTGGVVKKYYYAGSDRVAEVNGGALYFLLSDHLGSTAKVTYREGGLIHETRYHPWGGQRYTSGALTSNFRFTGQRHDTDSKLYDYQSRWSAPAERDRVRQLWYNRSIAAPGRPGSCVRIS